MMESTMRVLRPATLFAVAALLAACGKNYEPKPPAAAVPPPSSAPTMGTAPSLGSPPAPAGAAARVSGPQDDPAVMIAGGIQGPKPATWVWVQPTVQFRTLQYTVPGEGGAGAADLIVSVFPRGGAGPVDANLERWRMQFTDSSGSPVAATPRVVQANGLERHEIDLKGNYSGMSGSGPRQDYAQLGVIVVAPDSEVYIRLLGPAATVEKNRAAWEALMTGLKPYSPAG